MTPEKVVGFRAFILFGSFANTLFAFIQKYVFNLDRLDGLGDNIKGVFIGQGAGHVVGATVALSFSVYYVVNAKSVPIWLRLVTFLATFWHLLLADAKQVLLVFAISGVFLLFTKFKNVGEALKYIIIAGILGSAFLWCMENVPAFSAFNVWLRPEMYGPDGEATRLKSATFRIVPTFYNSSLNSWFGLGPGHTVGRLGGWMLEKYQDLLAPLGATVHPASSAVWGAVSRSWLGDQSSMFSPLFGWAGIWGDLGFVGIITLLYLWSVVWRRVCVDDISRFFVLNVLVFGLVFSQMEEPGYMLYVASLIALQWQERQASKLTRHYPELAKPKASRPKSIKGWIKVLLMTD